MYSDKAVWLSIIKIAIIFFIISSTKAPVVFGIFNTSGQRILNDFAQGEKLIDVSKFPAGLYFIKVADGQVARFVKQ